MEKRVLSQEQERKTQAKREKNFVRLNINLGRFKLSMRGEDAKSCLQEVNKILDRLNRASYNLEEDFDIDYRLESFLSDELTLDPKVTKLLNKLSDTYRDYRTSRVIIESKKIVELEQGKVQNQIDLSEVKKGANKLLFKIQKDRVKHAVIHVKGNISEEEANKILDNVERELQNAQVHKLFTKNDMTETLVEGVFFGDFQYDYEEEF